MAEYVPHIQDKLRLQGYPLLKNTATQELVFGPTGMSALQRQRWQLQDKTETREVVLTESFVALQTTAYTTFEEFVRELVVAVDTVAAQVQGLLIQRIGLRYVDLVREPPGESWRDYLHPGLQGLQSDVFLEDSQVQLHQSVARTARGTMVVRLSQNRDGQVLPPDLTTIGLASRLQPAVQPDELLTTIDLDHFSAHQVDYERTFVEQEAWRLHDDLDRVFREGVVTEKALAAWA